jgi:hypothetical protein
MQPAIVDRGRAAMESPCRSAQAALGGGVGLPGSTEALLAPPVADRARTPMVPPSPPASRESQAPAGPLRGVTRPPRLWPNPSSGDDACRRPSPGGCGIASRAVAQAMLGVGRPSRSGDVHDGLASRVAGAFAVHRPLWRAACEHLHAPRPLPHRRPKPSVRAAAACRRARRSPLLADGHRAWPGAAL